MRHLLPLTVLALLLLGVRSATAEESELNRYKREQLVRIAETAVTPSNPAAGGIDDIRRFTQAQRKEFGSQELKAFDQLDELVGTTAEAPRGETEGMIRQAARFYRWVVGKLTPAEMHDLEELEAWRVGELEKSLRELRKASEDAAKLAKEGEPVTPFDEVAVEKEERKRIWAIRPPSAHGGRVHMPRFFAQPPAGERVVLTARPPEGTVVLTPEQRDALLRGDLSIALAPNTGSAGDVINLSGIRQLWDAARLSPGPDNWRFALVQPDELSWAVGVDWLGWRRLQLALRREAMANEAPQGLVSDAEVHDRRARLERFKAAQKELLALRALVQASFGRMTEAQRAWRTEVGKLGFAIEETSGKCANCSPEELEVHKVTLARQQLAERAAQQELRLLYITALRADARIKLIEEGLLVVRAEISLAATSLQTFVNAQSRTRRETQLGQLRVKAEELAADLQVARAELDAETDPKRQASWKDYIGTLEAIGELNTKLASVVQLRRTLESRAAGKTAAQVARREGSTGDASAGTGAEGESADSGTSDVAAAETDPLVSVRDPSRNDLNENYVQLARELLSHPDFDADLVAAHHAAVDDSIEALVGALEGAKGLEEAKREFEELAARVESRLPAAPELYWQSNALSTLRQTRSAYSETVSAIQEKEAQIRERVAFLDSWRDQLEDLGVRSFAIRQDRTLNMDQLGDAGADIAETGRKAAHWFVFDGDEHIGTFAKRHWVALLMLLGVIVLSFFVVRYARRWIDARLTSIAARVPHLRREPVTISGEAKEAKEQRVAAERARREAEAAALADASGESDVRKTEVRGGVGEAGEG